MSPRLPNFFIIGAAKCGTTSLASYLEQHPQVFSIRSRSRTTSRWRALLPPVLQTFIHPAEPAAGQASVR